MSKPTALGNNVFLVHSQMDIRLAATVAIPKVTQIGCTNVGELGNLEYPCLVTIIAHPTLERTALVHASAKVNVEYISERFVNVNIPVEGQSTRSLYAMGAGGRPTDGVVTKTEQTSVTTPSMDLDIASLQSLVERTNNI